MANGATTCGVRARRRPQASPAYLAAEFASIDAWRSGHAEFERPIKVRDLFDHLVPSHAYPGSYQVVLRYVRARFGRPRIRTYRPVETGPGSQCQSDWGVFPPLGRWGWCGRGDANPHGLLRSLLSSTSSDPRE